jgi:hypothetical protein
MIHKRERRAGPGLTFPIKLRCASIDDICAEPGFESALARALGRSFARARRALPASTAIGGGVALKPPYIMQGQSSGESAAALLARVSRAISLAAAKESIQLHAQRPPAVMRKSKGIHQEVRPSTPVERFDPVRYDAAASRYDIPSFAGGREVVGVRQNARRRPWYVAKSVTFKTSIEQFIKWREALDPDRPSDDKTIYLDLLTTVRSGTAWLVAVNQPTTAEALAAEVFLKFSDSVPARLDILYGYSIFDVARVLLAQVGGNSVMSLPALRTGGRSAQMDFLDHGQFLLFAAITVPIVTLEALITRGQDFVFQVHIKDLDFLINEVSFELLFGVPWNTYRAELGDRSTELHALTVYPNKKVHFNTLSLEVKNDVVARTPSDTALFGALHVLNQSTLDSLPSVARDRLSEISDDATKAIEESRRFGQWGEDWIGAYVYATLPRKEQDLGIVRYRPLARQLTPPLVAWLQKDSDSYHWARDFYRFLKDNFGASPPNKRPADGSPFEFVLAELEDQHLFDKLFDQVESASEGLAVHQLAVRLALATRYADHPRVQRSLLDLGRVLLGRRENRYRDRPPAIFLGRSDSDRVDVRVPFGNIDSIYIFERKEKRLRPDRAEVLKAAILVEKILLIERIFRGEEKLEFDQDRFASEVLDAAVKRMGLNDKDFEKVTIQRSLWILDVQARMEAALPRFYITFQFIERVEGEEWHPVSKSFQEIEDEFEARLIYWGLGKAGEFYEAAGIAVTAIGLIAVAWQAGLVAVLVEVAGGSTTVLASIGISEVLFIYRVVFRGEEFTLRNFVMAAVDGYLGALGFRGAGFLGKWAAEAIGFQSLRALVGGAIAEKLIVGVVGGAGTAALTTFSHDLVGVATGEGGWSSIGSYVRNMTIGAVFGVAMEIGGAAILKGVGGTALESIVNVRDLVRLIRQEGINAAQWNSLLPGALRSLRSKLGATIGDFAANGFVEAMGERLQQLTGELGGRFVSRRLLELAKVSLTDSAQAGLEKLLTAAELNPGKASLVFDMLGTDPENANAFLDFAGTLDGPGLKRLLDGTFHGSGSEMAEFLAMLRRLPEGHQQAAIKLLGDLGNDTALARATGRTLPARRATGVPPRSGPHDEPSMPAESKAQTLSPHVDRYPEGLVHLELTRPEAYQSFQDSIAEDQSREAAIYFDAANGEHIVVQGSERFVDTQWMALPGLRRPWQLLEHYHPEGDPFASIDDFEAMMDPQLRYGRPEQPLSTRIRWVDPASKIQFVTEIGYTPGIMKPYWIKFRNDSGAWEFHDFADTPWNAGSDYIRFLQKKGVPQPTIPARTPGPTRLGTGPGTPPQARLPKFSRVQTARIRDISDELNKFGKSWTDLGFADEDDVAAFFNTQASIDAGIRALERKLKAKLQTAAIIAEAEQPLAWRSLKTRELPAIKGPDVPEGQRLPRATDVADPTYGGQWSGVRGDSDWYSDVTAVNRVTNYEPIPFRNGFPDFSRWSRASVFGRVTGNDDADFAMADRTMATRLGYANQTAFEAWRKANGLTWHHVEGAQEQQLVPADLNNNVPHVGGASEANNK